MKGSNCKECKGWLSFPESNGNKNICWGCFSKEYRDCIHFVGDNER